MHVLIKYILVFLGAACGALLLTPLMKRLAPRMGMVDRPSARRIHKNPIPRNGGVALFLAVHLTLVLFFRLGPPVAGAIQFSDWSIMLAGSGLLLLLGILDDRSSLRPWMKLAGQTGVAAFMFFSGFSFGRLIHLELGFLPDLAITVFWFLLLINAFNLIDGLDGVCAGLGLVSSAGLTGVLIFLHQPADALVLIALSGACLGFLRYNFHPASVFLGDCGSMFIGFMLAAVSLKASVKQSAVVTLLIPLLSVGVPIFDVFLAVWRRLARKVLARVIHEQTDVKVFGPDLEHLHHKLLRMGLTQRAVAWCLYLGAIGACLLAWICIAMTSFRLALLLGGLMIMMHVVIRQLVDAELWTSSRILLQGIRLPAGAVRDLVLIGWDAFCLFFSAFLIFRFILPLSIPYWAYFAAVLIPCCTLAFFGSYRILWSRARAVQLAVFALELLIGEIFVTAVLLRVDGENPLRTAVAANLNFQAAAVGMLGMRIAPRLIRDVFSQLNSGQTASPELRTLLVGTGAAAVLFFRHQAYYGTQQPAQRRIVGIAAEDPALIRRKFYGYPVLGRCEDLETLIEKHQINEVILTENSQQMERYDLPRLMKEKGVRVLRFNPVLKELDGTGSCRGFVPPGASAAACCSEPCANSERNRPFVSRTDPPA